MSSQQTLEPNVQESVSGETCPRCHTTSEWGDSSWCPDCGYYPIADSGDTEGESWLDRLPETPVEQEDNRSALESIPMWFWVMTAGIIGIAVGSVAIRLNLAEQETLRGRIALGQLAIGLISMVIAHAIAAKFAMAGDRRISVPDIFLSWFNIWQPTIGKLPDTSRRLLAVVWGMIACITAVTIIGGIDYGYPFRDHTGVDLKPMNVVNAVASAAKAQAAKNGQQGMSLEEAVQGEDIAAVAAGASAEAMSMEDAINQLGDMDEKLLDEMEAPGGPNAADQSALEKYLNGLPVGRKGMRSVQGHVYAVITNNRNIPTGLLFAIRFEGRWTHLTSVEQSGIPGRTFQRIIQKLNGKMTKGPFVDSASIPKAKSGSRQVWVRPHVLCEVGFSDATHSELKGAQVQSILVNQPGVASGL